MSETTHRIDASLAAFQQLADHLSQLVWIASSTGQLLYVNTALRKFTGAEPSEHAAAAESTAGSASVSPNLVEHLLGADEFPRWLEACSGCLADGKSHRIHVSVQRHSGTAHRLELNVERTAWSERNPVCLTIASELSADDLTAEETRKGNARAKALRPVNSTVALPTDNERYRQLFESMGQGFCIAQMLFDANSKPIDYRILEGNTEFKRLTGLWDIGDRTVREALPDLEFWWVETYGRIALTGTPERFEYYAAPMKKWFDVYAFPFGEREDYQVAILFHDITARRTAESAIADYRRRLDTALIAGEVGTFEWDVFTDRLWGDQNFARMFNVKLDSSGAAPLADYLDAIHPDDREEVQRAIETVLISGSELQCEYRVGSIENPRWIVARGKLERDLNGRAIRFPGIVLDVTERRNAESALRKNRELLTSIIDNADTAIYAKTADGKFILCNLRHAELLNRLPEEVIGKTDTELNLDIATATLFANNEKAVIAGNLAMQFEESFATPEGRRVFVSTKFPLHDAQDEVYAVCSIATDFTSRKRSIEQLRRDQERVRLTQQTAGIGTFDWDIKQNINSWSPELESLYGLQPGSFDRQREPWKAFVHEEDVELAEQKVREALSKGLFQAEWRIVRPDGEVRWITARAKVEFDESGEPIRMLGVNIDTTERELTLRALRDSEQRFRELADAMPQLVWIADDDGTVTYYNNQSQNYEGIERDADGRFVWKPVVYEDDLQLTVNTWETAVRTGQAYQCEHRIRMRDGTFRWHLSRALRVDGLRPRWYGTATDVHELKLAEHAMRESEERFRTLADNMSQLAWMADSTGAIFWFNQRWFEYTGSTPEQMLGHGWQEVHHREHLERVTTKYYECIRAGSDWEDTFPLRGKDGQYNWFLSRAVPIRNANGEITRWFGTNTNVTEFRNIEAELRRAQQLAEVANKAKSDFLANMSHEIRSPMTSIIGFADLLTTEHPEEREKIETIRRNGQYLLSLINDILDLSKIEAGKLSLDTLRFSPQTLLEEVMKLMRVRAAEGGLEIALEFQSPLPDLISSDPIRIRQILINLVGNAIKFTESGSVKVLVSFSEEASELSIRVVDTGIGLSSEDLQRLFHPFSQADATISRRFGGSGLGLAISQRLASLLGGRITVESEQGKGSCFTLILPVKGDFELRPAVPHLVPITAQMTSSVSVGQLDIRVLVVDDRRDVRFLVQVFVNKLGGKTVLCENGEEAIARIRSDQSAGFEFDIVLMDMQMPVMDGITAVRQLRSEGYNRPVIALTANAMNSDREICMQAGFNDYLSKPVDANRLTEVLRKYCARD